MKSTWLSGTLTPFDVTGSINSLDADQAAASENERWPGYAIRKKRITQRRRDAKAPRK
jgi:hypothetical protein